MMTKRRTQRLTAPAQRAFSVLMLCVLCTACGMNLRPGPVGSAMSLAGSWQAPAAQRDKVIEQLRVAMKQAEDKQDKKERKRDSAGGPPGGPPGGTGGAAGDPSSARPAPGPGGRENWETRERHEQQQALIKFAVPAESFVVTQVAGRIDITPNTGARRSFTPGEPSTLVTTFGSFYLESGWQNDEFVVHSKDSQDGINVVERYHKQPDGGLAVTVTLATSEMKEQTFKLVYSSQH